MIHVENLSAGSHTIRVQWRTSSGTLRASESSSTRTLIAIEL